MHDDAILDRIFMIAERLIVFDGLDDVFEHIVKTAATLTRAEAASLCVFDLPSGMLKIAKAHGADDALLAQVPVRLGEGIAGHVVRTGRPFTTADVAGEPLCENPQLARAAGIRALLCVPMNTRAGTIGCITAYRKGEDAFSEHDLLLLSLFASEAVEAAEKERLLRSSRRWPRRTASPACWASGHSWSGSRRRCSAPGGTRRSWRCCSSISTGSSATTTPTAT